MHAKRVRCIKVATVTLLTLSLMSKGYAVTLDEALVSTYKSNPELKAIISTLQADVETYPQAFAGFLPTMDFLGSGSYIPQGYVVPKGDSKQSTSAYTYGELTLDIRMNLFKSFGDMYALKSSSRAVKSLVYNFYANEQGILYKTIEVYMNLITAEKKYELKLATEKSLETNLNIIRARINHGEASTGDKLEAEASHATAVAERIDAESTLTKAKNDFFRQVGLVGEELETPAVDMSIIPDDKETYVYQSLYNNALLLSAFYNRASARYQVTVTRAALLPSIDATASASHSNQNVQDNSQVGDTFTKNGAAVGLQLKVPIYDAGYHRSRLRATKNMANAAHFQYQNVRNTVLSDADSVWDNLKTAKAYRDATDQGVRSAETALESTRSEYKLGTKGIIDLLNSEQTLLNAQLSKVNGEYQYVMALYNAMQVMGILTPENLKLSVMPYNPDAYFKNIKHRFIRTSIPEQEITDRDDDENMDDPTTRSEVQS